MDRFLLLLSERAAAHGWLPQFIRLYHRLTGYKLQPIRVHPRNR
ncbi:hypothetical protein [Intestinibacillus massiliensis]|nr:hypothetical protein [Intestinibacillus massiliensis]